MRKQINNSFNLNIVKIVLFVLVVGSPVWAEGDTTHTYNPDSTIRFIQGRSNNSAALEIDPLKNFLSSNKIIGQRIDALLVSPDPNDQQKVTAFIDSLPVIQKTPGQINGALGNLMANSPEDLQKAAVKSSIDAAQKEIEAYLKSIKDPATIAKVQASLKQGLPQAAQSPATGQANTNAGTTGSNPAGATAGTTAGRELTPEEKAEKARQEAALDFQRQAALAGLANSAAAAGRDQNGGKSGSNSSGGPKSGGPGGAGSPPNLSSGGKSDSNVGDRVQQHAQDQKSKESDNPRGLLGNNNFGNNNSSSNSEPKKDPFKKDDKDGGFKLPEAKTDKNAAKTVSKTTADKNGNNPLDPSGDLAEGPGLGYKNNLALTGPSKVPGLAPKPNAAAMLAAVSGGGSNGGGDSGSLAGANIKGGPPPGGAAFEGNPFAGEGMMPGGPGGPGAPFRKFSPEAGAGTDGEGVDVAGGGSTNDFKKKGMILDQILTLTAADLERLKLLGAMYYVSRPERICIIPGVPLLGGCPKSGSSRRAISIEEAE